MPKVLNKYKDGIPQDAVYIGRGSPWGNPFSHMTGTKAQWVVSSREEAIERFKNEVLPLLDVTPLRGKDLVCFCAPKSCHGDVLMEAANG